MRDRIKEIPITDIFDLLGVRYKAKKALCPLHNDRTPSMSYDLKRNTWYCFVCGVGGDSIRLVEKAKGLEFKDALKWMASELGIPFEGFVPNTKDHYAEALNANYETLRKAIEDEWEKTVKNYHKIQARPKHRWDASDYNFESQYHDVLDGIEKQLKALEDARTICRKIR